jgi:hypothetical protein
MFAVVSTFPATLSFGNPLRLPPEAFLEAVVRYPLCDRISSRTDTRCYASNGGASGGLPSALAGDGGPS